MPPHRIRVVVVDDERTTRVALSALLHSQPDITVVGFAADAGGLDP